MNEHDAVELALLRINRSNKKTHVQTNRKQDRGRNCKPRDQLSGQAVKGGG